MSEPYVQSAQTSPQNQNAEFQQFLAWKQQQQLGGQGNPQQNIQYQQFLLWQQNHHQQQIVQPHSGSSYNVSPSVFLSPSPPYTQQQNQQSQQTVPASCNGASTPSAHNAATCTSTVVSSDVANTPSGGNQKTGGGCFNPITSLLGMMELATTTMNNITATQTKTTSSFSSMKNAFSGMIDGFQNLGKAVGGCADL